MAKIVIKLAGECRVNENWQTTVNRGINRLYFISGGSGGHIKEGKRIPFLSDTLYFLPPFAEIQTYTDEPFLEHSYVNFEMIPPIISSEVIALKIDTDPIISQTVSLFTELCKKSTRRLSKSEKELLSSCVLYLCERAAEQSGSHFADDEIIIKALSLMHSDVTASVKSIAEACYMSTDGFIRRFKRCIGKTPYAYIKLLRLRAAEECRQRGMSLSETAEACGYSDASALLHALSAPEHKAIP